MTPIFRPPRVSVSWQPQNAHSVGREMTRAYSKESINSINIILTPTQWPMLISMCRYLSAWSEGTRLRRPQTNWFNVCSFGTMPFDECPLWGASAQHDVTYHRTGVKEIIMYTSQGLNWWTLDGWIDRQAGWRTNGQVRHLSMIWCETAKFQLGADFPEHVSVLNRIYRILLMANIE